MYSWAGWLAGLGMGLRIASRISVPGSSQVISGRDEVGKFSYDKENHDFHIVLPNDQYYQGFILLFLRAVAEFYTREPIHLSLSSIIYVVMMNVGIVGVWPGGV